MSEASIKAQEKYDYIGEWSYRFDEPDHEGGRCLAELRVSSLELSTMHVRCHLKLGHYEHGFAHSAYGKEEADKNSYFAPYKDLMFSW